MSFSKTVMSSEEEEEWVSAAANDSFFATPNCDEEGSRPLAAAARLTPDSAAVSVIALSSFVSVFPEITVSFATAGFVIAGPFTRGVSAIPVSFV